jgi:DNA (cytosine-5)-methyltransferase 1
MTFTFIDLFAGIGGIRLGFEKFKGECVFTSEWDKHSKITYKANGRYEKVQFGKPINFESFISMARRGDVFCDCGMYSTNLRPYMTWRASKNIWNSLAE